MNAEKQIIGSLLIDPTRIDDLDILMPEMFKDPTLGQIFSIYKNANGKEVNVLTIVPKIITSYRTEKQAQQFLVDIAHEHDAGISDKSCEEIIFKEYKAKKVNEMIERSFVTAENVDEFLSDMTKTADVFQEEDDDEEVMTLSQMTRMKDDYFNDNHKVKFEIGIRSVDEAIGGIDDGDIMVLAARPSVGKSAMALQMARKFGRENKKVGFYNLEMGAKQIYERAVSTASGIDMTRIRRATNYLNDEQEKFENGNNALMSENNVYFISGSQTIEKIRAKQRKYKFDIIFIDYMQLITPTKNRGGNRASEVGDISRGLKAIAREFNIPVIALSQLNRFSEKLKEKEPSLSELRESGDIEQDASIVLMMWNSNDDDETEKMIKVEKSRNGFRDKVKLYFDGKHMRFDDATEDSDFREPRENEDIAWE